MRERKLQLGVAGLGRGFMSMLPTLRADERIRLVAAADPRAESRAQFVDDFGGRVCASVDELCDDPEVEVVYIATPHQYHAEHCIAAARCGKHMLVEKPMAVTLADCAAMIDAARRANVHLVVGHSHSFDAPYLRTRALIASGAHGRVRMITAVNFTDFLYRPRRPDELDTAQGGGAVFSQGAHQIDVVRLLGGGHVHSIRAHTGAWDGSRPTEGAFSALLTFDDGAFASLTYSGYAHFDSDELVGWIGEMGIRKDAATYGATRAALRGAHTPVEEAELKRRRAYGAAPASSTPPSGHNHFGVVIASCERADLRPLPTGVMIYGDERAWMEELAPPGIPRIEVIDELYDAVVAGRAPMHGGEWAMATLEACLAILESARLGKELRLHHQVGVGVAMTGSRVT
jgi:phthalate 4,5-cis-dihydrodiol dehydrogenase